MPLWPFLFVTIACGACSGFHGLVCSGTTSKQVMREGHCRPVGYGGMLLEAFVALIALSTIVILAPAEVRGSPARIYGDGLGRYLTVLLGPERLVFATTFGALAFSTFVFDTLDVATRLGRYLLQELFGTRGRVAAWVATLATLAPPFFILAATPPAVPGQRPAYMDYWLLFGTSNQLLAALTLLGVTVWLYRSRRPIWYTLLPMVFVFAVTLWSLVLQVAAALRGLATPGAKSGPVLVNGIVALALIALALTLVIEALRAVQRTRTAARAAFAIG
jgi:carbon starvation protein